MDGTNYTKDGLRRVSRTKPWWNVRLVVFALVVGLAALLLAQIQSTVARHMADLGTKFGDLTARSFYVGVELRASLRHLKEQLLQYKFSQSADDWRAFTNRVGETKRLLAEGGDGLRAGWGHTERERELFGQIQRAYDWHLAAVEPLLAGETARGGPGAFATSYQIVQKESQPLLDLIEQFVEAQKAAFGDFLQNSRGTLDSLGHLLNLSQALLLASTVALAALIYRGMIAPLHRQLTESQAILERQEKLASLGTLAAGVAHEIRNPLTAIKFRLFSLKKSMPPEFARHEDTGVITAELNRLERIVKDFLQFARPSDPELVRLPAQRLLEEVRELLQAELKQVAIELRFETPADTWIQADTHQLKQVLINLIQNAAESMGHQGVIRLGVRADVATLDDGSQPVTILWVEDTGPGIPPEVQKRLFDPFFTTKEDGTGLGLAIAARIVTKHGGLLRYRTQLNRGTVFEIVLPRIEDEDHGRAASHH